ncbi:MAG: hypothetical protein Kow0074_02620 [Candidatus Zixiibacteriota bacterium]
MTTTTEQTRQDAPESAHQVRDHGPASTKKSASNKKRKSTKTSPQTMANRPGPFEVRVDDAGTVMPSFWRFGA